VKQERNSIYQEMESVMICDSVKHEKNQLSGKTTDLREEKVNQKKSKRKQLI
jgi:hypothetical protein